MGSIEQIDSVICGDVFDKLPGIPTGIVHCVVTSPPYWGLRDYGVDGQLGLEKTPEEYIAKMVAVFREVWRVLRDDGTLWLNLGDSYWGGKGKSSQAWSTKNSDRDVIQGAQHQICGMGDTRPSNGKHDIIKPKDLCGIPWRLALALQADGWFLRQDIIWHKPNPMPESVTDRCTKAHEYIFLMTKKARYYYDVEAIKEESVDEESHSGRRFRGKVAIYGSGAIPGAAGNTFHAGNNEIEGKTYPTRNKRSVWTVEDWGEFVRWLMAEHPERAAEYLSDFLNTEKRDVWTVPTCPYPEAHFATFPPDLILPCILAGCPQWVCKKCGEPRRRIIEKKASTMNIRIRDAKKGVLDKKSGGKATKEEIENYGPEKVGESKTTGWTDCGCDAGFDGGIVLDPFMGSGTVAAVAYENNRHYIGIELNPDRKIQKRVQDVREKYALFGADA